MTNLQQPPIPEGVEDIGDHPQAAQKAFKPLAPLAIVGSTRRRAAGVEQRSLRESLGASARRRVFVSRWEVVRELFCIAAGVLRQLRRFLL